MIGDEKVLEENFPNLVKENYKPKKLSNPQSE
jgi:hypothetical protein